MTRVYVDLEVLSTGGGASRPVDASAANVAAVRSLDHLVDAGHELVLVADPPIAPGAVTGIPGGLTETAVTAVPVEHGTAAWYLTCDVDRCRARSARLRPSSSAAALPPARSTAATRWPATSGRRSSRSWPSRRCRPADPPIRVCNAGRPAGHVGQPAPSATLCEGAAIASPRSLPRGRPRADPALLRPSVFPSDGRASGQPAHPRRPDATGGRSGGAAQEPSLTSPGWQPIRRAATRTGGP